MAEANEAQIREWHEEGLKVVSAYKRCEYHIVSLLSKLIESRGYLLYKSESPRQYAVCVWGLPDNAAADLVTVASKAIEIPALLEALEGGRTTVSKLRKVCPVIDTKNHKEWIGLTIECSARIVERAVAMTKAETAIYDQLTYKFGNRVEMKAGISEEVMFKLQRVRDLLSQKLKKSATIEEAIEAMAEQFLERNDPVVKAERARARMEKQAKAADKRQSKRRKATSAQTQADTHKSREAHKERTEKSASQSAKDSENSVSNAVADKCDDTFNAKQNKNVTCRFLGVPAAKPMNRRRKFRAATVHTLNLRDGGQCTELGPDGERCKNRRWLDTHHVIPLSEGGTDEPENLTTLCSGHHRMHHFMEMRFDAHHSEARP